MRQRRERYGRLLTHECRDEVRRFEQKMDRFSQDFQEGLDLTLWQVNKNSLADSDDEDAFCVESQPVTAKLDLKGDKGESGLLTASVLFNGRVGYLRSSSVFGVLAGKIGGGDEVRGAAVRTRGGAQCKQGAPERASCERNAVGDRRAPDRARS